MPVHTEWQYFNELSSSSESPSPLDAADDGDLTEECSSQFKQTLL